jgi:uncharacterized protein (TIGR02145 family)
MRRFLFLLCILVSVLFIACSESFTDPRDGQSYDIVKIGGLTWFAENLNFATEGSVCPEGDSRKCSEYGRLYTWDDARTSCPEGWRLPDSVDFALLITEAGGADFASGMAVAGEKLKSTGGWFKKGNGTDALGFNALPAGYRGEKYDGIGGYAYFWSATATPDDLAYYLFLDFSSKAASMNAFPKGDFRSVRCVKAAQVAR